MKGTELAQYDREDRIWDLRIAGLSYRAIADEIGLSHTHVALILNERLQSMVHPKVEEYRTIMHERCEAAIHGLWPRVQNGELGAVQAMLRVMERQAKLNALDLPPQQIDYNSPDRPWTVIFENMQSAWVVNENENDANNTEDRQLLTDRAIEGLPS